MRHPLAGVRLRLQRSDAQINRLREEVLAYVDSQPWGLGRDYDEKTRYKSLILRFNTEPSPEWPLLVSEAAHHMRSALNGLVYALALLDKPTKKPVGTSFPIYVSKVDYLSPRGRKSRTPRQDYLDGLNDIHMGMVDGFQPFDAPRDPLARLAPVSNSDKHEDLAFGLMLPKEAQITIEPVDPETVDSWEIRPPLSPEKVFHDGTELLAVHLEPDPRAPINVIGQLRLTPVFGDELKVDFEELFGMQARVVEIVKAFEPDFG
jgi:hypothetical protein